ncbi:acyl-CoA thioesterase II [Dasania marina]|uniref:acyl-CoA thioesterase n=1 Tax=Dasania marina TaxID=471499 RepID=UPI0030D9E939|tara:strand:- start:28645 stop:29508 length:864 start_codon:yes stop_codon:yes gene_type:complete
MFGIDDLLKNLQVEQLDTLLFRGQTLRLPLPQVYGGQVLAQALNAASRTVDPQRHPHSLHAYFLRRGDQDRPIIYDVDPIRDGGSFSTRRVVAKQNGKAIFNCAVSFQTVEPGLEHQIDLPIEVPPPEDLEGDNELVGRLFPNTGLQKVLAIIPDGVVDLRSVNPRNPITPTIEKPQRGFWLKFNGELANDPALHRTLLTYISDWGLMETGLYPHPIGFLSKGLQAASLDHAMWFHTDFRVDDWIYYHMDSPCSAHARGFNRGSFYTRGGQLIASSAQEGLMRVRDS